MHGEDALNDGPVEPAVRITLTTIYTEQLKHGEKLAEMQGALALAIREQTADRQRHDDLAKKVEAIEERLPSFLTRKGVASAVAWTAGALIPLVSFVVWFGDRLWGK